MIDSETVEALVKACFDGKLDTVRAMVESGVDVNTMGRNWNPLHAAIENMEVEVVRYLLQSGADREFVCFGFRPIHHAIDIEIDAATQANAPEDPDPVLTELLLSAGVDMNAKDAWGQTPLQMATQREHKRAIQLLRSRGAVA